MTGYEKQDMQFQLKKVVKNEDVLLLKEKK